MESGNEKFSCVQESGCADEGDTDEQWIAETFSQHHVRSTTTVTVRELRSEGLSFQLWPAANAMCLYIEKEFGEGEMSVIDARPPNLEWDLARWCNSYAIALERNLDLGDSLSEASNILVVDGRISSVNDKGVDLGNTFNRDGKQQTNSNGRPEAQVLEDIGQPLATSNIVNQMDPIHLQDIDKQFATMNCNERNGTHTVDKSHGIAEGGHIHLSTRRMRVLELGSGTGMVGIVAACLGADVVLTDLPHVIPNLSHNLDLNESVIAAAGGRGEAKVLRWGVEADLEALGERSFDLILASDCVYHDTSYKPFLETLTWLMRSPDMYHTGISTVQQSKSTIPEGVLSALPSQLPEPALSLLPVCKRLIPVEDAIDPDDEVSGKDNGEQPASRIDTSGNRKDDQSNQRRGGNECVILLGHMRRWKKDSKFFRMASKVFDVSIVHRHPPEGKDRIGPIIYRLSTKLDRKTHSSRTQSSSSVGSLSSCSPSRRQFNLFL